MKLDPNLEKFKDVFLKDIKRGWTNRAMQQARDYLSYIHNDDVRKINYEMNMFADYLRDVKKQLDSKKVKSNEARRA